MTGEKGHLAGTVGKEHEAWYVKVFFHDEVQGFVCLNVADEDPPAGVGLLQVLRTPYLSGSLLWCSNLNHAGMRCQCMFD